MKTPRELLRVCCCCFCFYSFSVFRFGQLFFCFWFFEIYFCSFNVYSKYCAVFLAFIAAAVVVLVVYSFSCVCVSWIQIFQNVLKKKEKRKTKMIFEYAFHATFVKFVRDFQQFVLIKWISNAKLNAINNFELKILFSI